MTPAATPYQRTTSVIVKPNQRQSISSSSRPGLYGSYNQPATPPETLSHSYPPRSPVTHRLNNPEQLSNIQLLRDRLSYQYQLGNQYNSPYRHHGPPLLPHQRSPSMEHPVIKTEPDPYPPLPTPYQDKISQLLTPLGRHGFTPYDHPMSRLPDYYRGVNENATPSPDHHISTSDYYYEPIHRNKRGRPRKHAPKMSLPPLFVFIRYWMCQNYLSITI